MTSRTCRRQGKHRRGERYFADLVLWPVAIQPTSHTWVDKVNFPSYKLIQNQPYSRSSKQGQVLSYFSITTKGSKNDFVSKLPPVINEFIRSNCEDGVSKPTVASERNIPNPRHSIFILAKRPCVKRNGTFLQLI